MNHPAGDHRDTGTGEMAHTGHELGQHWESHCSAISDSAQMLWQEGHTSVSHIFLLIFWLQINNSMLFFGQNALWGQGATIPYAWGYQSQFLQARSVTADWACVPCDQCWLLDNVGTCTAALTAACGVTLPSIRCSSMITISGELIRVPSSPEECGGCCCCCCKKLIF